jgi:hypothetical protein
MIGTMVETDGLVTANEGRQSGSSREDHFLGGGFW